MSKQKLALLSIILTFTLILVYTCNTSLVIHKSFHLVTQDIQKRPLPSQLNINATVLRFGGGNALVFGSMDFDEQHFKFQLGSLYNSSNRLDSEFSRLTCVTKKTQDAMMDYYILLPPGKSKTVDRIDLIEALTPYKTLRTESEYGTYVAE